MITPRPQRLPEGFAESVHGKHIQEHHRTASVFLFTASSSTGCRSDRTLAGRKGIAMTSGSGDLACSFSSAGSPSCGLLEAARLGSHLPHLPTEVSGWIDHQGKGKQSIITYFILTYRYINKVNVRNGNPGSCINETVNRFIQGKSQGKIFCSLGKSAL